MPILNWIDKEQLKALKKCKDEGKTIFVEVCNEHGETGWIKGKIAKNANSKYIVDGFVLLSNYGKHGTKKVNIKLDRANIEKDSAFIALSIVDSKTKEVIYENPNRKFLLHPEEYDGKHYKYKDQIEKIKANKNGAKFLKNIGQYVEFVDAENEFNLINGIIKSVYVEGDDQKLYAKIVRQHSTTFKDINDEKCTVSITNSCSKNIREEAEEETM